MSSGKTLFVHHVHCFDNIFFQQSLYEAQTVIHDICYYISST